MPLPERVLRRREITETNSVLHELNLRFPGERKKSHKLQDPEFRALRNAVMGRRMMLDSLQKQ